MNECSKEYDNFNEMIIAAQIMGKFQSIHNIIRNDYMELLRITEENKSNEKSFNSLYRASLKSLFSLMEADIYCLNLLDQYENYKDSDAFINKFKDTYRQISSTWKKEGIQKKYFDSKLNSLRSLRRKRDELTHPKEMSHIHVATHEDFESLKNVFNDYDKFINDLMNGFFISTKISLF